MCAVHKVGIVKFSGYQDQRQAELAYEPLPHM